MVAPGTDPSVSNSRFPVPRAITIDGRRNLVLHTSAGEVVEHAPVVYQQSGGGRDWSRVSSCSRPTAASDSQSAPTTTLNRSSSIRC